MEVEIEHVELNYLTAEKRLEITVRTATGRVIIFPAAQHEVRTGITGGKGTETIYAYARKEEALPTPRIYTILLEEGTDGVSRQRLDEILI